MVRSFLGRHRAAVVLLVVFVVVYIGRKQLPDIDLEKTIEQLSQSLGAWTYLLVGALAFLETGAFVGLIAPGEFTVMLGGAVAGQGQISLPLILAVAWFSAFAGDTVSFFIGRKLGRDFLVKHGNRFGVNHDRLEQVESYFDRHGGKTILIGRFIGIVRALAPFIAGSSKMRYGAFAPYSILGTGLWAGGLTLVGYFFSRSIDKVAAVVGQGLLLLGVAIGVIVGIVVVFRFMRDPENRAKLAAGMESRPVLRQMLAAGRRVQPQARFVWARFTPGGGTGLELTSLLAVLAVGLYVLIVYWAVVSGNPGATPGDRTAFDIGDALQTGWLTNIAKVITELGASYITIPIAIFAALWLATERRWAEVAVIVIGMTLIVVATGDIKDAVQRPRPPDPLVSADGYSFPSAHASYSTVYVWLAATVAIRLRPGWSGRTAVIAAGIVLAGLIGLTRVYLRVHYLSDVSAGWGLGLAAFAACAAVALVVTHIRHNASLGGDGPK